MTAPKNIQGANLYLSKYYYINTEGIFYHFKHITLYFPRYSYILWAINGVKKKEPLEVFFRASESFHIDRSLKIYKDSFQGVFRWDIIDCL